MSVSGELLCSFELLKPLDSTALKNHIKKGRNKRNSMLNSPVSPPCFSNPMPSDRQLLVEHANASPQIMEWTLTNTSPRQCLPKAIKRSDRATHETDINCCDTSPLLWSRLIQSSTMHDYDCHFATRVTARSSFEHG